MDEKLRRRFPGVDFTYSQNIEDNIDEALVWSEGGLERRQDFWLRSEKRTRLLLIRSPAVLDQVRGVKDVFMFRSLGQPNIVVTPDRAAAAG